MKVSFTLPLPDKDFKAVIHEGRVKAVGVEFFDSAMEAQALYKLNAEIKYAELKSKKTVLIFYRFIAILLWSLSAKNVCWSSWNKSARILSNRK